jgi:polysaccharide biosynthesis protein PslH
VKILFLQKRILFPADTGGKIRTLNVLRHLARRHHITYLCNVQPVDRPYLAQMQRLGVRLITLHWRETPRGSLKFYGELLGNLVSRYPYNVNKDYAPALRERAVSLLREEPFDLVICDFVQMARNVTGLTGPPKLLFEHNVEGEVFARQVRRDLGWLRAAYMYVQSQKMQRFEAAAGRDFDTVVAVSERDRSVFEQAYGWQHVRVIDTAVDVDFFTPLQEASQPGRVVFVGSMDWMANEDGVSRFIVEIWPKIRVRHPQATFQVVGRNPSRSIRRFDGKEGVEVTGTVDDVRPYLARSAVVVVPLQIGGGTRLKIFEAMAMGRAVVTTSLGCEGLDVRHQEHLLIADDPSGFADSVVALLERKEARRRLGAQARRHVVEHYSAERIAQQFERICLETIERHNGKAVANDSTVSA